MTRDKPNFNSTPLRSYSMDAEEVLGGGSALTLSWRSGAKIPRFPSNIFSLVVAIANSFRGRPVHENPDSEIYNIKGQSSPGKDVTNRCDPEESTTKYSTVEISYRFISFSL